MIDSRTKSRMFVISQLILLAVLVLALCLSTSQTRFRGQDLLGGGIALIGLVVLLSALWEHHRVNKTLAVEISPEPPSTRPLMTSGIYALVRHPMYLSVILASGGLAVYHGSLALMATAVAIWIFCWLKARFEETLLSVRYGDEYQTYMTRTGQLFPFVGRQ